MVPDSLHAQRSDSQASAAVQRLWGAAASRVPWEPRPRRIAWLVAAAVMALAPALFTVARQAEFSASVDLFPARVGPLPAVRDLRYYQSLLRDPELLRQGRLAIEVGASVPRDVTVAPSRGGRDFVLAAVRPTPNGARNVANAMARQVAYA